MVFIFNLDFKILLYKTIKIPMPHQHFNDYFIEKLMELGNMTRKVRRSNRDMHINK